MSLLSEKLLINQLDPLTKQQLLVINNLQQSSQQAEDALSQGMEALQQSLAETLAGYLGPSGSSGNVANYMGQMAMAMGKLGTLEGFIQQMEMWMSSNKTICQTEKQQLSYVISVKLYDHQQQTSFFLVVIGPVLARALNI
ncbi:hypothetical protein H5410_047756 [Solanum commersonii]|uniref:DOG1 domain-containing protein n=1 Tax=Solanum commersonii TaxID=4109 RepID=A0A9J5XI17_SOLCO|nr:hypothetical protein H5410_047756 [Solanum commersonii]